MNGFTAPDAIAVAALALAIMKILTGPIGRAIGERLRGAPPKLDDSGLAVEMDALRVRLAEVEERLDFAERLLASGRQADQLPGGAHR